MANAKGVLDNIVSSNQPALCAGPDEYKSLVSP
jgi:hypothetical protein